MSEELNDESKRTIETYQLNEMIDERKYFRSPKKSNEEKKNKITGGGLKEFLFGNKLNSDDLLLAASYYDCKNRGPLLSTLPLVTLLVDIKNKNPDVEIDFTKKDSNGDYFLLKLIKNYSKFKYKNINEEKNNILDTYLVDILSELSKLSDDKLKKKIADETDKNKNTILLAIYDSPLKSETKKKLLDIIKTFKPNYSHKNDKGLYVMEVSDRDLFTDENKLQDIIQNTANKNIKDEIDILTSAKEEHINTEQLFGKNEENLFEEIFTSTKKMDATTEFTDMPFQTETDIEPEKKKVGGGKKYLGGKLKNMFNDQASAIHKEVVQMIVKLMKVDESTAKLYKSGLWSMMIASKPNITANLDRCIELKKMVTKENLSKINVAEVLKKLKERALTFNKNKTAPVKNIPKPAEKQSSKKIKEATKKPRSKGGKKKYSETSPLSFTPHDRYVDDETSSDEE